MTDRTVLIIDDEAMIRELTQVSLELAGWRVLTAESGPAGLARAIEARPEAILLDVMMPGMDGPQTLAHLKAHPATCHIPVIFLTATAGLGVGGPQNGMGAAGVLAKPFDPFTLSEAVASALAGIGG